MPDVDDLAALYAYPDRVRPWVRTNFVASVDGAAQGPDGVSGHLGGQADARVFKVLRSLCDVVVVGAGTARDEEYGQIGSDSLHAELREGRDEVPVLALVSRSLTISESLVVPGVAVITSAASPAALRARLAETVEVIVAGDDEIDWTAVMDLFAVRGWTRVLCEGGPSLHGTLIAHDLVDEVCLTVSPHLVAGSATRIAASSDAVLRDLELGHCVAEEDVLLTRWVRARR